MSISADILQSWRAHRTVVRRHLARGQSEPFAFTLLLVFLIMAFIAQWPRAARIALEDAGTPLSPQLLALALGILATIPFWYGMAALSRIVLRAFGGRIGWYQARIALFASLDAAVPMVLIYGLAFGTPWVGFAALAAFLIFWGLALREVYDAV